MGFTGTPAAEAIESLTLERFGTGIIGIGQYNRRKISGSTSWSQHSWGNAIDIHVSVGKAEGGEKIVGDAIAAWLREHKTEWGIRYILWWRTSHWDHIHADFWPKGIYTPPLSSTGIGTFKYRSGRIVKAQNQKIPADGNIPNVTEPFEKEEVLREGDKGRAVADVQAALIGLGFNLGDWPAFSSSHPKGADGDFGGDTTTAVKGRQKQVDLAQSGVVDGVTIAFIMPSSDSGGGSPVDAYTKVESDGRFARKHGHPYAAASHPHSGTVTETTKVVVR